MIRKLASFPLSTYGFTDYRSSFFPRAFPFSLFLPFLGVWGWSTLFKKVIVAFVQYFGPLNATALMTYPKPPWKAFFDPPFSVLFFEHALREDAGVFSFFLSSSAAFMSWLAGALLHAPRRPGPEHPVLFLLISLSLLIILPCVALVPFLSCFPNF